MSTHSMKFGQQEIEYSQHLIFLYLPLAGFWLCIYIVLIQMALTVDTNL